jgi:lysozyme family protein
MRNTFEIAFPMIIGLEGKATNDPNDPGHFTIWGLSSRWNPGISPNTTLEDAKSIYYNKYWVPAGCEGVGFPMDICLFDGAVNSQNDPSLAGTGNQELLNLTPESWQDFLLMRAARYMRCSQPEFVKGHIFRVLKLYQQIKNLMKGG